MVDHHHHEVLPNEILLDIFSRLPTKFLVQCRCLSKTWRYLLSSPHPQFNKKQNRHEQTLLLISSSHSICSISPNHNTSRTTTRSRSRSRTKSRSRSRTRSTTRTLLKPQHRQLQHLLLGQNWAGFIGSVNGLVLFLSKEEEEEEALFLANPTTLQLVKIPACPLALKRNESFRMHGFGHNNALNGDHSREDEYKIVTLSYYKSDCGVDTFVDVYSVKKGVWRRAGTSPYDHAVPNLSSGVFLDNALHWLARNRAPLRPYLRSVIAVFQLGGEEFYKLRAPFGFDVDKSVFNQLAVLGGRLCLVDVKSSGPTDLWIMDENGLRHDSWTKLLSLSIDAGNIRKPLYLVRKDVVLVTDENSLVIYDTEKETLRDMVVDEQPAPRFIDAVAYLETNIRI